jgi:tetratricopeptide (TPR) repeat protein
MKHKGEAPRPPRELNPGLPDDLSGVILKCLEKDRAKRYQSASELHADLEKVEHGLPTTARVVPERKPLTSKQITVQFEPRKVLIPGLAALAVIAAGIIILSVLPRKRTALRASGRPTVAVVNFENKTGDEALDIWTTGIRDLLIMDLNQSKFMKVLSDTDIYGILRKFGLADTATYSTGDLVKIADAGGAQYTVNGSFLKAGDEIIINAACQKPHSRDVVSPIQVTCRDFGEIRDRIDEMTRKIKADLNLTPVQIAGDIDRNIGEISTPNTEAWAYYVESRRCHFRYEFEKAIPLLQKALALDPEFIIAYRALAVAHLNISDFINQKKYYSRALELIQSHPERVSDRDRLFIEQDYYLFNRPEPEWGKLLEAGRKLLALYPQDTRGAYNLGMYYARMEDWNEALKYFETCVSEGDFSLLAYSWLSDVFLEKGEPEKAREILEKYLRDVENNAAGRQSLAYHHIYQNRLDLAARELEAAETLAPDDYGNRVLRAYWLVRKGDLPEAEAAYRALIGEKIPAASYGGYVGLVNLLTLEGRDGELIKMMVPLAERFKSLGLALPEWACHWVLARAHWRSGRTEAALDECRKAYAIDTGVTDFGDKRSVIHLRGLIYLTSKRVDEAEKTAGELKAFIEKGLNKKAIRLYDHLMGSVEMERNNIPKALEYLEKSVRSDERNTQYIDTLAEAYVRAGDLSRARGLYEKITRLTARDNVYALSFYHLGQIDEKLGDKTRACESYAKFLELWKDADPGFAEVGDAQKRLAALRN